RIVGGAPVCAFEVLQEVVREFEADARMHGLRVCYFASEAHLESVIARQPGYSTILLGAQPVWRPAELARTIERKRSLRAQLHRAWKKGVVVEQWSAEESTNNPRLHAVLTEWLSTRGLPSLHFLVEPETLSNLADRRIFVAWRRLPACDEIVGFLNVSPVPLRHGWLVEQFVRGHHAPNGTVELMLHAAAEQLAEDGFEYLTLGLSPLIPFGGYLPEAPPAIIRFLLGWARAHGKRFYDFEGLEFFKSKFEPERWEPIYAISNEPRFSFHSLYAIACAFTNGRPVRTMLGGVGMALGKELKRLTHT
ncbi:MAG: phosphatidylglycerol lysyltransferase domain-containing protein, partial [Candidatus Kapaibacterium sp.]